MEEQPITPNLPELVQLSKPVDEFSGTEGIYLLPHHDAEIERLQKQHEFIKSATGGFLTNIELPADASILDCGCADGTWLADMGNVGNCGPNSLSLYGVDLGCNLFQRYKALDLREHDLRKPFPPAWNWSQKFDLVHQRLLVWGIASEDWPTVIHRLADAVKPGGYIQLVEAEWVLQSYTDEQPEQKKLAIVQEWSCASSGMDVHIWKKFPSILAECGFEDITERTYSLGYGATTARPEDRQWTAELLPKSFRHLARIIPDDGIPGVARDADEYKAFLERLTVEMKEIGYTPRLKWTTARRPI